MSGASREEATAKLSPATIQHLQLVRKKIPALSELEHKGQRGRIGILGGSFEYTGAPYFAGMSAFRCGADLVHIMCAADAAIPIKSYSPDLIVHPFVDASDSAAAIAARIASLLERLHVLVVGPGLGRSELVADVVDRVVARVRELEMPIIVDADGLYYVTNKPELVRGYTRAVLTPNKVEYARLCQRLNIPENDVAALARNLRGVTVVQKGQNDVISDGTATLVCDVLGSPRRCGGLGDLLCGAIAAFVHCDSSSLPLMCFGACALVRAISRETYARFGRTMVASDGLDAETYLRAFGDLGFERT